MRFRRFVGRHEEERFVDEQTDGPVGRLEHLGEPAVLFRIVGQAAAVEETVDPDEPPVPDVDAPVVGADDAAPAGNTPSVDLLTEHERVGLLADVVVARNRPPRRWQAAVLCRGEAKVAVVVGAVDRQIA
jgi:hypothetical protein